MSYCKPVLVRVALHAEALGIMQDNTWYRCLWKKTSERKTLGSIIVSNTLNAAGVKVNQSSYTLIKHIYKVGLPTLQILKNTNSGAGEQSPPQDSMAKARLIRSVFIISNREFSNWASQILETNMWLPRGGMYTHICMNTQLSVDIDICI